VSRVNLLSSITRSFVIMVIVCFISNPMFAATRSPEIGGMTPTYT
jgi:hypothetical protein